MKQQLVTRTDRIYEGTNPATFLAVHETANRNKGASAQAHANLQSSGNVRNASWHIQSDDKEIIRSFPNTTRCWHAGDGKGPGNYTAIAWEICINPESDFKAALDLAARGMAKEMEKEDIPLPHLVQHNHWSGKDCPHQIRSGEYGTDWLEFVDLVAKYLADPIEIDRVTTPSRSSARSAPGMVSPLAGYLTQRFKPRQHLGMDIGTGGKKVMVKAAFSGTITSIYRGAKHGNRNSTWAAGRTSNAPVIQNRGAGSSGDNEYQAYGHVTTLAKWKVGDFVNAGEDLGWLDNSGQWTGWHLHFEMWSRHRVAYNPQLAFDRWGLRVGSAPVFSTVPAPTPKPPVSKPQKPVQGSARIKKIQQDLNRYANAGLYVDGVEGKVTKAWIEWVKALQRALPAWRGVPYLLVDGHYGKATADAVKTLQRNNKLHVDGEAGSKTINYMRANGSDVPHRPKNRP